jgi:ABC-type branched-subunit amino acid transport system substrate-binding protein
MRRLFYFGLWCSLAVGLAACGTTQPPSDTAATQSVAVTKPAVVASDDTKTNPSQQAVSLPVPKPTIEMGLVVKSAKDTGIRTDSQTANSPSADAPKITDEPLDENLDIATKAADSTKSTKPFTDQNTEDVINSIIWKIQSEASRKPPEPEPVIPVGQDPSLASDALEAAFALLGAKLTPQISPTPQRDWAAPKAQGVTRVALLLPVTGPYQDMGNELRRGAELALFSTGNAAIELLTFDTTGGQRARRAAEEAVAAQSDIIIGPLFTDAVEEARSVARAAGIPMLLLSNNAHVAAQGSWLMGYLPEQQLDLLLTHAIVEGRTRFAIIAEDTAFGKRLATHTQRRLSQLGMPTQDTMVLRAQALASEDLLKRAIRGFARYVEPVDDTSPTNRQAVFDTLIFAGGAEFALRTAPVLAYYDLGSDTVMYLGNEQWNKTRILSEPSLQGGLFAFRPSDTDSQFVAKWGTVWQDRPGLLARLSFDAFALAGMLADTDRADWKKELLSNAGFNGFSGPFRLLPDGVNVRAFELRQINQGASRLIQPAPDRI